MRAGPLIKLSPSGDRQERHFFLFSDMILYGKKTKKATYEYKDHIELFELSVRAAGAGGDKAKGLVVKDLELAFEIVRQGVCICLVDERVMQCARAC